MTDSPNPAALLRHAALVGDLRLVDLLALVSRGRMSERPAFAQRVYDTLVARLSLGDPGDHDRP